MKRYVHELHGFHEAYTFEEETLLKKFGWTAAEVSPEIDKIRAKLDAIGVKYHANSGLEKLKSLLPSDPA